MRLWDAGDWEGILELANSDYREKRTLDELRADHEEPKAAHVRVRRGTYIGTPLMAEGNQPTLAQLYFALPREREPVMVVMTRESGRWRIVP